MTFTDVHRGCQKVPKSDFQSQFSMFTIHSNLSDFFFLLKNIRFEEGFLLSSFFENFNFWTTLFSKMEPNFWRSVWTFVKVKSKNYFYFTVLYYTVLLLHGNTKKETDKETEKFFTMTSGGFVIVVGNISFINSN